MLIAEELLLIVLDDETGELQYNPGVDYDKLLFYAYPAALLMDLVLHNRISIEDNHLHIIDSTRIEDELLDKILKIVQNTSVNATVPEVISVILGKISNLQDELLERLAEKNILKREGNKYMKKFHLIRYPLQQPEIKYELMNKIGDALTLGDTTDTHLLYFIGILLSLHILQPEANNNAYLLLKTADDIIDFHNLATAVNNAFFARLN
jgi:predicted transcriptional regulator